jgi:hypothetical protein
LATQCVHLWANDSSWDGVDDGRVLVRRELCADGVERVVYRSICTKVHSFPSAHSLSPSESSTLDRYAQNSQQGAKVCGAVVYNQIHSDIARSLVAL